MTSQHKKLPDLNTHKPGKAIIRIAIVDDHPLVATGLQALLSSYNHLEVVAVYPSGSALLQGLEHVQPDILLLDIHLPDSTGDKIALSVMKRFPSVKIIALTSLDSPFYLYNMMKSGVSGYLLKTTVNEQIITAIETVYEQGYYLESDHKKKMDAFAVKIKNRETMKPSLTQKEKEVLKLTVQGLTLQEISKALFLGQRTVEYYRANLLLKLNVKNMAELIRKCIENNLVD
jgi:DNA-binding NarL/FixJ family response regulator